MFYEAVKGVVHRRINAIVRALRVERCQSLAKQSLDEIRQQAILMTGADTLLTDEQRTQRNSWIDQTSKDAKVSEDDRKLALAMYVISEQRLISQ